MRTGTKWLLGAALVVSVAGWTGRPPAQAPAWQHNCQVGSAVTMNSAIATTIRQLQSQGWEMVSVTPLTSTTESRPAPNNTTQARTTYATFLYCFKRPAERR
jgi:hypothetical protein